MRSCGTAWLASTQLNALPVQNSEAASPQIFGDGSWHVLPTKPCLENAQKSQLAQSKRAQEMC